MKLEKKWTKLILINMISVLILAFGYMVYSSTSQTLYLSGGIYSGAPSLSIFKEDSTYYIKDAYGNQPSWSATTNASYIFNQANNLLDSVDEGSLYIKGGDYYFDNQWRITADKIKIYGEGYSTRLFANDGLNDHLIYLEDADYLTMEDFRVWGNKEGQTSGDGIYIYDGQNCHWENIWVWNAYRDGWHFTGSGGWSGFGLLVDCHAYQSGNDGFTVFYQSDIRFVECIAQDSIGNGFDISTCCWFTRSHAIYSGEAGFNIAGAGSVLENCYFDTGDTYGAYVTGNNVRFVCPYVYWNSGKEDATYDGIYCTGNYPEITGGRFRSRETGNKTRYGVNFSYVVGGRISNAEFIDHADTAIRLSNCRDCSITGNPIHNNGGSGIYFNNVNGSTISANPIFENVKHGISLYQSNWNSIEGNTLRYNDLNDQNNYDGIILTSSDDNIVNGNACMENDHYQINIFNSACDNNLVSDNRCDDTGATGNINDSGTGTTLADNVET